MRGKRTPAEVSADAETAGTEQFIKRVRRASRRQFSAEEKVRVVLEGFRREVRVSDLCRREGIRPNVYYAWLKDFMEAGKTRLRPTRRAMRRRSRSPSSSSRTNV